MRRPRTPAEEGTRHFRRSKMPNGVRFALLATLTSRPAAFRSLDALCRRIHRDRRGAPIQLADHTGHLQGDGPEGRRLVGVYTQTDSGAAAGFLGWAWLDGAGWRQLQQALYAAQPNTAVRAEAA